MEAVNTSCDVGVYHALEVQIDDMYHGRQGAVAVGVLAARQVERASAMPWTAWSSKFKSSPKLQHIILEDNLKAV